MMEKTVVEKRSQVINYTKNSSLLVLHNIKLEKEDKSNILLPLHLGEGFLTHYSTLGLHPKLKAEGNSDGPAPLIYGLDRGILTSWV